MEFRRFFLLFIFLYFSINSAFAVNKIDDIWQQAHDGNKDAQAQLAWLFNPERTTQVIKDESCNNNQFFANNQCQTPNYEDFCFWTKKAVDQNVVDQLHNTGFCYEKGYLGTTGKNLNLAMQYYYKAADTDVVQAKYSLGNIFFKQNHYQQAENWYLKAAQQNYLPALKMLVHLYLSKLDQKQTALNVINKMNEISVFESETINAENLLANYYLENGDYHNAYLVYAKIVKKDPDFSLKLHVQTTLAWLILNGYGIEQNISKAIDLYYDCYRDLNLIDHDELIKEITKAEYINKQEKLWNLMFVDIISDSDYVTANEKLDLLTTFFPDNPDALTQFDKQIAQLKQTKIRDLKFKYAEYFPPFQYDPDLTCRDFLREFDANAPDFFQYDNCKVNDGGQTRPVSVTYKIEGKYAKQAHQYIAKTMGIGELKLICCAWVTEGGYPSTYLTNPKDNLRYMVSFSSEETIEYDWNKITFYLVISGDRDSV